MNKFICDYDGEEVRQLETNNILHWEKDGKSSGDYLIFKTAKGLYSLINFSLGSQIDKSWNTLEEMMNYFATRKVDKNEIYVNIGWVIYNP